MKMLIKPTVAWNLVQGSSRIILWDGSALGLEAGNWKIGLAGAYSLYRKRSARRGAPRDRWWVEEMDGVWSSFEGRAGTGWGNKMYIYQSPRSRGRNRGKSRQSRQHIDIDVDIDFHNEPKIRRHLPLIHPVSGRLQ
jgi:hypothetical protein